MLLSGSALLILVLAWPMCLREDLLVRASDASASLGGGDYVVWQRDRMEPAAARAFRNWLVRQATPSPA